jgi:hypothetical protein
VCRGIYFGDFDKLSHKELPFLEVWFVYNTSCDPIAHLRYIVTANVGDTHVIESSDHLQHVWGSNFFFLLRPTQVKKFFWSNTLVKVKLD